MGQITSGARSALSIPLLYDAFQHLMGARKGRAEFVNEFVRAQPGDRLIDFGCGTAEILNYLPAVDYTGVDISQEYISAAQTRFGDRGTFICGTLDEQSVSSWKRFDIAIGIGVLHHLDEENAVAMIRSAYAVLEEGGRLITIDPCFAPDQSILSHFLVSRDRGQNVRSKDAYLTLVRKVFANSGATVKHRTWIPYTHCIVECTK